MAFKYPFSNYHELNLTWVLSELKKLFRASEENVAVIETYNNRLAQVETTLPVVADTAENAQDKATQALTKANQALTLAEDAPQALAIAEEVQESLYLKADADNLLKDIGTFRERYFDLTFTWNENKTRAHITGNSPTSYLLVGLLEIYDGEALPSPLEPGEEYNLVFNSSDNRIRLFYIDSLGDHFVDSGVHSFIPSSVGPVEIALEITTAETLDADITILIPAELETLIDNYIEKVDSFIGSLPPSYVIVDKKTNTQGVLSADTGNCTSRVVKFSDYVKVIAPDGINVTAVDCTNHIELTGNPLVIPPNVDIAFNFNKSNGVFSRADFDSITFKSSQSCWNIFNNDFIYHVTGSSRLESWNTQPENYGRSFAYSKLETGDRWGFISITNSISASVSKLLIADTSLLIVCQAEITLIINDALVIVPPGTLYRINKGDAFIVSSMVRSRTIIIISNINSTPLYGSIGNQVISSSLNIRCDSAFLLDEKLVMIANTGAFNVLKDNAIIQSGTISGVGHANSCNYITSSKMLYVSTWTDGRTIACYKVTDGDTVSFEFIKNIVIDNASGIACEYFVADENEKVIIGLGWKYSYNKPTNESQNALEVSVYTKINGVYEVTKRFLAFAPGELQGMTFNKADNCIYYLAGAVSGYNHTSINAISLDGYSHVALAGTGGILNIETESIIQITNSNNYLVVAANGTRFVCGFD